MRELLPLDNLSSSSSGAMQLLWYTNIFIRRRALIFAATVDAQYTNPAKNCWVLVSLFFLCSRNISRTDRWIDLKLESLLFSEYTRTFIWWGLKIKLIITPCKIMTRRVKKFCMITTLFCIVKNKVRNGGGNFLPQC